MKTIGIIGAGNMAAAIANGILGRGMIPAGEIEMFDIDAAKLAPFTEKGVSAASSAAELVKNCRYVLLAVKPQVMPGVLEGLRGAAGAGNVFVSIAAGISSAFVKKALGFDAKVILVMPNTPVLVGLGASALSFEPPVTEEEFETVRAMFASAGIAEQIAPNLMNEVIPINGSSPAFLYRIAQIFVEHAVGQGFDRGVATRLFCQTMIGSAHMMLESGKPLEELIRMVCSPGGTTLRGLEAMEKNGLENALAACIDDCIQRAYELGV